jgi:hypothetical protein
MEPHTGSGLGTIFTRSSFGALSTASQISKSYTWDCVPSGELITFCFRCLHLWHANSFRLLGGPDSTGSDGFSVMSVIPHRCGALFHPTKGSKCVADIEYGGSPPDLFGDVGKCFTRHQLDGYPLTSALLYCLAIDLSLVGNVKFSYSVK